MRAIEGDVLAVDTECAGLDPWHGVAPYAIGFCNEAGETLVYDWPVDPWTRVVVPDPQELENVRVLLEDTSITKVFHNSKFDIRMLSEGYGIETQGRIDDTMFQCHACNTIEPTLKLKALSIKYLGYPREDLDLLQKVTVRLRRKAKERGWAITEVKTESKKEEMSAVMADAWLVRYAAQLGFPGEKDWPGLVREYCRGDVERTMLLHQFNQTRMDELCVRDTYDFEVNQLRPVAYRMESRGIWVCPETVDRERTEQLATIEKYWKILQGATWPGFNPDSPPQAGKLVYERLKLPIKRWTETGKPQVNYEALEEHTDHPIVSALFHYRAACKALKSFFDRYRATMVHEPEHDYWVIHPDFTQMGPATGRFSCSNPNVQNTANALTTRSLVPIQARRPFGPRPGYTWYCIDYDSQEGRIFADVADELQMMTVFRENKMKIHKFAADKAWGGRDNPRALLKAAHALELDGSTDDHSEKVLEAWKKLGVQPNRSYSQEDRLRIAADYFEMVSPEYSIVDLEASLKKKHCYACAKMVNFLEMFGGGAKALAKLIRCPVPEAQQFIDDYEEVFPRIRPYHKELGRQARLDGCIWNRYGRRIAVSPDAPYTSVNYMVQGSAADLMKRSMVRCEAHLRWTGLDAHIVMTIHDELVFEIRKEHAYVSLLRELCSIMADHEGHFRLDIPVDMQKVTNRWDKKEKVKI